MVSSILFSILFFMLIVLLLVFIFEIFIPSIDSLKINLEKPIFSVSDLYNDFNETDENFECSKVAFVEGNLDKSNAEKRFSYGGVKSCAIFKNYYDTEFYDSKICFGFGDCQKVCKRKAVKIENGKAIITSNCNACGDCISACPINLISLVERKNEDLHQKKSFKFWLKCYKILNGKIE